MNSTLARLISRTLIASMVVLPLQGRAGLVGTESVVAAQSQRDTVRNFMVRPDVAGKLQALGVPAAEAQKRVAALTDAEAAQLADRINSLPAGADPTTIGILLVIALVIWRLWVDAQEKETAAAKRAPSAKPAPAAPAPAAK
ncbi:MAG: PA2779 family protein [Burkholderiales bacterium]